MERYLRSRVKVLVVLMVALVGDGETYKSSATGKSQAMWGYSKLEFGAHSLPLPLSSSPPLPTSFSIPPPSLPFSFPPLSGNLASDKDSPKELKLHPCPSLLGRAPCHSAPLPEKSKEATQTGAKEPAKLQAPLKSTS